MDTTLASNIVKCVTDNVSFSGKVGTVYSVQDLFHLVNLRSLNDLYKNTKKVLDSLETDSLYKTSNTAKRNLLELQVATIKGVFEYKQDLAEKAKNKAELAEKKARLKELLAKKELEAFESKSVEELQKEIQAIEA